MLTRWILLCLCALLTACAATPPAPPPRHLLNDALFEPSTQPIHAQDVFALSDEMRDYLKTRVTEWTRRSGRQKGLLDALYARSELQLQYDTGPTRTASEAFAARSGNCLSLVIMTAAFAKALDLHVEYQSAFTDETWSRSGQLYFRSGHVNITLTRRAVDASRVVGDAVHWTVDFLPPAELRGLRIRQIDENELLSMFYNNRAAETLAQGQIDQAYWWAREATLVAPQSLGALNTLGVIYQRRGLRPQAEKVFAHVLQRDPQHTRAMHNLVQLLAESGRTAERDAFAARLAALEPEPPFRYFELGQTALRDGDFRAAREWFAKEVARAGYSHEFHFWLGVAHFKLGEMEAARREMELAQSHSATRGEKDLYAAKLARLKELQSP
jgi:Flp pilus assembly protein TadD